MKSNAISFLGLNIINLFLKGILQMLSRNLSQITAHKSVANIWLQYLATIEKYSGVIRDIPTAIPYLIIFAQSVVLGDITIPLSRLQIQTSYDNRSIAKIVQADRPQNGNYRNFSRHFSSHFLVYTLLL